MIDVKSRRCAEKGCEKYPAFNYANESTSRYCGEHKKPGMVDVHNKRCAEPNCNTRPTFNFAGKLWSTKCSDLVRLLRPRWQ
jgi:hypothetical protein